MPIDPADKTLINEVVNKLVDSQKPAEGSESKEFLLHLYDQLWENMRSKENRLWTFLSLYGAAVGLVFAGGQTSQVPGADLFALIIVTALTTWAVLIMLNANFWVSRNLLMVIGIENRFPGAKSGIYPKVFPDEVRGRFDRLYRSSILVLCILISILYVRAMWPYRIPGSFESSQLLVVVAVLYVLFTWAILYCLRHHEEYICIYHETKRNQLDNVGAGLDIAVRMQEIGSEIMNRRLLNPRPYLLILLVCVAALFDFIVERNGYKAPGLWLSIAFQVLAAGVFILHWCSYSWPFKRAKSFEKLKSETTNLFSDVATTSEQKEAKLKNIDVGCAPKVRPRDKVVKR